MAIEKKFKQKRYHSGWVFKRIDKLQNKVGLYATTEQIRTALRITERTLRYWAADPYFKQAEVATMPPGTKRLLWDLNALLLWLVAIGKVKHSVSLKTSYSNPSGELVNGELTREGAREELGIPLDHVLKIGKKEKQ